MRSWPWQALELTARLTEHLVGLAVPARTQVRDRFEVARAPARGLSVDGRFVPDLESSGLSGETVQAASGLVDDLGRGVDAFALREGQFLAHDGHMLGRRDLEDQVDGRPQFEVQFGGHDALHRSILARRIGCFARGENLGCRRHRVRARSRPVITRVSGGFADGRFRRLVERIRCTAKLRLPSDGDRARDPARERARAHAPRASVLAARGGRAGHRRGVRGGGRAARGRGTERRRRDGTGCRSRRRRAGRTRAARPAARADLRRLVDVRFRRRPPDARLRVRRSASAWAGRRPSTASAAAATSSPGSTAARTASASPHSIRRSIPTS